MRKVKTVKQIKDRIKVLKELMDDTQKRLDDYIQEYGDEDNLEYRTELQTELEFYLGKIEILKWVIGI